MSSRHPGFLSSLRPAFVPPPLRLRPAFACHRPDFALPPSSSSSLFTSSSSSSSFIPLLLVFPLLLPPLRPVSVRHLRTFGTVGTSAQLLRHLHDVINAGAESLKGSDCTSAARRPRRAATGGHRQAQATFARRTTLPVSRGSGRSSWMVGLGLFGWVVL